MVRCELAMIDDYTSFHLQNLNQGQVVNLLGEPSTGGLELQPDGRKLLPLLFCKLVP
jgi:hypothetical protein